MLTVEGATAERPHDLQPWIPKFAVAAFQLLSSFLSHTSQHSLEILLASVIKQKYYQKWHSSGLHYIVWWCREWSSQTPVPKMGIWLSYSHFEAVTFAYGSRSIVVIGGWRSARRWLSNC